MTHIARALASVLAGILLAAGCAPLSEPSCPACAPCAVCPPARPAPVEALYEPAAFDTLPGWRTAALAPGLRAFLAGCPRITVTSPLASACDSAKTTAPESEAEARRFIEATFAVYAVLAANGGDQGLITGYYEPVLHGSRSRTARFRFPVHGVPDDLIAVELAELHPELRNLRLRGRLDGRRLVPYGSRSDIESGTAAVGTPVLAWVEDPVELFFLQIQGSGQIEFTPGERIRVGYADQNGHPYRSLGRHLVDQGELRLEQASMQGIKAWAAANPGKLREALNVNASYVFFRELQASGGPIGALGVALTAGHSIAVDPRYVPMGAPVFLVTTRPNSDQPLERLVAAQDTGGAIRGAVRADFFWGLGADAGALAGRMRQQGRMWLLWPRGAPPPRP